MQFLCNSEEAFFISVLISHLRVLLRLPFNFLQIFSFELGWPLTNSVNTMGILRDGSSVDLTPMTAERVEDGGVCGGDKEKKKNKRRSTRRSKQSSPVPGSSLVSEIHGESLQPYVNGSCNTTKNHTFSPSCSSPAQLELDADPSSKQGCATASTNTFKSMPTMHITAQAEQVLSSDHDDRLAKSCPEPIAVGGPLGSNANKDVIPSQFDSQTIFSPHWSMDAVNEALEKGDAFKALFRVNAYNRLEAYCKIDGVPTDVLISGVAAQNRAVDGDVVTIKVDALSSWPKLKGSNGSSNKISLAEKCNLYLETNESACVSPMGKSKVQANEKRTGGYCKGRTKMNVANDCSGSGSSSCSQRKFDYVYGSGGGEAVCEELNGGLGSDLINGCHPSCVDSSQVGSTCGQNEVLDGVGKICAMISSYPLKRPTARVVAINEKSPRRDAITGFLDVKQWLFLREGCKKDAKRNKISFSYTCEYIELMPTDPKFPNMVVNVSALPDCIKKRLEDGDITVQMELVAAQIDNWLEVSPFPLAHVSHVFGRGSEMKAQISAILHQNAICASDFSPESLSCLPSNDWEVPAEEFQSRRDLRNMCIFTIDPSTATDLDDALSVESLSNGNFRVGVHIADVSYFVLPDTALDIEAQVRSTTVYMLQQKLPMLPPPLSENMGSLNPGVDRLAFSIFWDFDSSKRVVDRWMGRTVIRSCCKLSYEQAQDMVDGMINEEAYNTCGNGLPQLHGHFGWVELVQSVKCLYGISKILREKRFNDGALRLGNPKISFSFDEYGVPYDSMLYEQKDSNFLVEEFMLLANMTAAEVISRAFPDGALLRRHPEPNMRKLREFEAFCCKHGFELDTSSSGNFHRSLESIREKLKDDHVLFDVLTCYATRPMQPASYFCSGVLKDNMNDCGHYALAVPLYTHFTSPLRRYPDIVVHRMLAATLDAEELYMKQRSISGNTQETRYFTGVCFNKDVAESCEGRKALSAAALKHRVPCAESLVNVVAHCNERKLASRHVKDACDKLYAWVLLKKKEVLSEARVLALGPRFMSVYIQKLAIERRIHYDEVEGLTAEWLEATSTLVLHLSVHRRSRRAGSGYYKALNDVALVVKPCGMEFEPGMVGESGKSCGEMQLANAGIAPKHLDVSKSEIVPLVSPLTVRLLSTIPVVLHAVGGDDGPTDIGVRLFMSSYFS